MKFISQIATAASGSVRGCVFSRNRSGAYIRGKGIGVNPISDAQQRLRVSMARMVARWTTTLTQAQRDAWDAWAFNSPFTDALGQSLTLTGQNAFIRTNLPRLQIPVSFRDNAPAIFGAAPLTPPSFPSASGYAQTIQYAFTNTDQWANEIGGYLIIHISRPQNPSVTRFKGPYRFTDKAVGNPTPPTSPETTGSPFRFDEGQRLFGFFRAILNDGRMSNIVPADVIVGA